MKLNAEVCKMCLAIKFAETKKRWPESGGDQRLKEFEERVEQVASVGRCEMFIWSKQALMDDARLENFCKYTTEHAVCQE